MKNELKISTLSIVCVLCAAVTMPSFGASAVRALGGAGTYSSASSAASSGASTVRGGSMRVTNAKPVTTTSTTRAATRSSASPRLSIGKYLGGATTVGGAVSGVTKPGQSSQMDSWKPRVEALEAFMGYTEDGTPIVDTVEGLVVDVETLEQDLKKITDVDYTVTADYTNDVLTIKQGDQEVLSASFATTEGLEEIQNALADLTSRVSTNELEIAALKLSKADVAALTEAQQALEAAIAGKQDKGEYAAADALEELAADVEALKGSSASGQVVQELSSKVAAIESDYVTDSEMQTAIAGVQALIPSLEDYAKTADVDAALALKADKTEIPSIDDLATKQALTDLQTALDAAIADKQDKGEYAAKEALEELAADVEALKGSSASSQLVQELSSKVAAIESDYVTDSEMQTAIAGVQALIPSLEDYAKTADVDAALALKADKTEIPSIDDLATKQALTDLQTALDAAIAGKQDKGEYAAKEALEELAADVEALKGSSASSQLVQELNSKVAAIESDYVNDSEMQAAIAGVQALIPSLEDYAKTADLATVATTGQYADLEGKPDIPSLEGYATEDYVDNMVEGLDAVDDEIKADVALKANAADLAAVATTGSYNDLIDQPDMTQYVTNNVLEQKNYVTNQTLEQKNYVTNETLEQKNYLTEDKASTTYLTEQKAADTYLTEEQAAETYLTESNVNQFVEIKDGSITTAKLAPGAVTSDKIDTELDAGTMVMLVSNGDGTSTWVDVTVD